MLLGVYMQMEDEPRSAMDGEVSVVEGPGKGSGEMTPRSL